jgi:predicted PurR-regulated permease PerM
MYRRIEICREAQFHLIIEGRLASDSMTTLNPTLPARKPANPSFTVLAAAAIIALLYFGRVFLITLIIAVIIAFLLDPVVTMFVKMRLPRPVSSFVVCSFALALVYLLGLGLYTEFSGLADDLPMYSQRINMLVDGVAGRVEQMEKSTLDVLIPKRFQPHDDQPALGINLAKGKNKKKPVLPDPSLPTPIPEVRVRPEPTPIWTYVYGYIVSFYDVLLMASFVPFLVYFMLSWRDHLRRSFLYLFDGSNRHIAGKAWEGVADMARGYVIGNFVLGLMLSVVSCAFFFAIRLPYWPIVGPVSSFFSLVPYVGMPLAIAPALMSGLTIYDQPAMYIIIAAVLAFLHLIAMNLLYPKVVGSRVHLNPLVVTIALMFWGTLWGGIGLLLAIPITAAVKAVCDNVSSLQGYGKLLGD